MTGALHVTDLDGTLLGAEARLAPGHAARIRALLDAGVTLSYATARSYPSAARVTEGCGFRDPVVVYGGAALVTPDSGAVLVRRVLEPGVVEQCSSAVAPTASRHSSTTSTAGSSGSPGSRARRVRA